MKRYILYAITERLKDFTFISRARRIEDNTIEIMFEKYQSYFFNLTRGESTIYKAPPKRPLQGYHAPFDTLLYSLLSGAKLLCVTMPNDDRILRFTIAPKSSYKDKIIYLQLEFTGRHTNAILLDENEVVIEALRHIDNNSSFRVIRPGVTLLELPPFTHKEESIRIDDIDTYLEERYRDIQDKKLLTLKQQKCSTVAKKIKKLKELLKLLPNKEKLELQASEYQKTGHIVLANLHRIKAYDTRLETYDFEGNNITVPIPKEIKTTRIPDYYFKLSKRAKTKAKNIYIEEENLKSKILFYENIYNALQEANTPYALELLVPKRARSLRKKEKVKECELFWIEEYKVLVGRNANENQKLLSLAKGNDIWMHTREIPGSHVIIRTDKQNLPQSVLETAAKLCVDFSTKQAGNYLVDYTKRKFVKIQEGAHVEYDKYQTLSVLKEGVEIRV